MTQKTLSIISILFFLAILIMPIGISQCGLEYFLTPGCKIASNVCGGGGWHHISMMRGLVIFGLVASTIIFAKLIFKLRIFSLLKQKIDKFLPQLNYLYLLRKQFALGRLKPFDQLLMAYSSGIIQPKTFC